MRGIDAAGVYLPHYRLERDEIEGAWGRSPHASLAVPAADEDALTMGVAAAESLFEGRDIERDSVDLVCFASTTPPVEEGMCAPRLGRALDLKRGVETAEHTQSTLAGAEALAHALDADGSALVVVADCPAGDPSDGWGAGAAAFLVTDDAAVGVSDRTWHADEYPGVRFRERGATAVDSLDITTDERAVVRESIANAVAGLDADGFDIAALHQPDGRMPGRVVRGLPGAPETEVGTVVNHVGDAGAATLPIGLARALAHARSDDSTLAGFFGGGGAGAAFAFEGSVPVSGLDDGDFPTGESISYASALRKRGVVTDEAVAGGGAQVSLPSWRRSLDQRYRLRAGRCPDCSTLVFPPEGACADCGSREAFEPVDLPRTGTVEAKTVVGQGGAPPEFAPLQRRGGPYGVAIVGFEADGHAALPAQLTDCDPESVAVGDEVRAVIRRIYVQEGVVRYGAKFVPR
ncbi:zinc ribbon domain-containing protein [Halococcus sp. IIIV-5B]|uniref:zinc ribbon domain-containing protein n=1 Tax=Halococcus sp. IIIV-5B TaxID=2321230 RepID=UPI000E744FDB|nr:zinc ribbon domain-containing protein [Halococcus sp. IIIV-5B]RJT02559.1 hydroxymethylglutaryl-CoA synthase family protein [Halococcus sp. IIIV-5B]